MKSLKEIIESYSRFVSNYPYLILLLVLIVTGLAFVGAGKIQMESLGYEDMLPDDMEVMIALDVISDQFGGTDSVMVALELEPLYKDSNEPRDIRNPDFIKYLNLLSESILHVDDVTRVISASTLLKTLNDDRLPKTQNEIINLTRDNPLFDNYLSRDYSLAIIRISLSDDFDEDDIVKDLTNIINEVPKVSGVKTSLAGETLILPIVKKQLGADMLRTSQFSLIGILVLLLLLFRSIRFGLTPLATIGVGILWAFGFIGFIGMGMNSATSGVISMIMGIGIDFGIQTVSRFRQELKGSTPEKAMDVTLNSIFIPMATTTMAALIGFRAMSLGELTMMGDMGTMMSYGITACFLAAITVVPSILVIGERLANKKLREKDEGAFIADEKKIIAKEKKLFGKLLNLKHKIMFKGGKRK
ncbi:MAG: MMPL family transporter [Nanoarchaeota archaeon]|nr:MMPL family transporter [Nanoarchaeota archaeon]